MKKAYVYLIDSGGQFFKIGSTQNMKERMKSYRTHNPLAKVLVAWEVNNRDDAWKLEKAMQQIALQEIDAKNVLGGEWYKDNAQKFYSNWNLQGLVKGLHTPKQYFNFI